MDVYQVITERITQQLSRGTVPWQRPWKSHGAAGAPRNLVSGHPYRGINVFLLGSLGYTSPHFLTYRQAEALGGHVKRGERGAPVVFWRLVDKRRDSRNGDETAGRYAMLRYYTVFNVAQCDGITASSLATAAYDIAPIETAEQIVAAMPDAPSVVHAGDQACYRPSLDRVTMPPRVCFDDSERYYSTLFHELTHATGHERRLNRPTLVDLCPFGSTNYSKEELVAEMGAAYLCAFAGIENRTIDNSAAYIAAWLHRLKDDARLVVHAAAQAQRAVDFIMGASAAPTLSSETFADTMPIAA
jgi:antirestriction protein ArdC